MAMETSRFNFGASSEPSFLSLLGSVPFREADKFFRADLDQLNGSGIDGEVLAFFDDDTNKLTLVVMADEVEANQTHIMHIHGFTDGSDASIPTLEDDTDGDGFIELLEGVPDYGPVLLNVRVNHDDGTGGDNGHTHGGGLDGFPLAPDGTIRFVEEFQLPQGMLNDQGNLQLYHFVIHGLSTTAADGVGTGGEVNGTAGYKLILPAAIGDFEQISRLEMFRELTQAKALAFRELLEDRFAALSNHFTSGEGMSSAGFV